MSKPLFIWAGGKNKMLKHYIPILPSPLEMSIKSYVEPFFGGGAMFIHMVKTQRLENIWINDNATNSLATAGTGDILCGLISGLLAQKMNFKKAILAAVFIQGELSQIENNLTAEDFLRSIPKIFLRLKNNN